jgi:hypothetical protein
MSRVRMPHNNRVSASAALRTNSMWSKTIGYDPYAAADEKKEPEPDTSGQAASLMLLAKMSNLSGVESRGGCKRCGMLGHMAFQCRNPIAAVETNNGPSDSSSSSDSDDSADERPIPSNTTSREPERRTDREPEVKHRGKRERSDSSSDDSSRDRKHKKSKSEKKDKKHKHKKEKKEKKQKHKKEKKSSR